MPYAPFPISIILYPTLGNKLRLLTNNAATSSEPLVHKNAPNSFLGNSLHRANAAHNTTRLTLPATQPPVYTWSSTSQHTTAAHSVFPAINVVGHSAQMGYAALVLHQPMAVLLTQTSKLSLALRNQHYSRVITVFSTFANTQSLRHGASVPQVGLINFNSTQYLFGPFQGPTYSQRGHHTNTGFPSPYRFDRQIFFPCSPVP